MDLSVIADNLRPLCLAARWVTRAADGGQRA